MTALPKSSHWVSPEEYLEGERFSDVRHEYVNGVVYAMAGTSDDHNRIARNLTTHLTNGLLGGPCEAFANDLKLKPSPLSDIYYYPDLMVVCDPTDNRRYFRERPTIIVEIVSPETKRVDCNEKLLAYRGIPTLDCYVILEQDTVHATVHRRSETGWATEMLDGPDAVLRFPAIQSGFSLRQIYDRTTALNSPGLSFHRSQD